MKLSVSIVTYQEEQFIQQTVESVLAQETDFPFEIIIGDDASTDRTRDILKQLQRRHPEQIKLLLPETNHGDNGLTNFVTTVENCSGEYVAFLDGDDYWTDCTKLQRQVDFLERHPECSFCAHKIVHHSPDGHRETSATPGTGDRIYELDDLIKSNFAHKISTVARQEAMNTIPDWYNTTRIASADWVYNLFLAKQGNIGFIDRTMAVHRKRDGNLSSVYGQKRILRDRINTLGLLKQSFTSHRAAIRYATTKTKLKIAVTKVSPGLYHKLQRLSCWFRSTST